MINLKKTVILNLPYVFIGLFATKLGQAWRLTNGADLTDRLGDIINGLKAAFQTFTPSFYPTDLLVGIMVAAAIRLAVYVKGKNAKKYRKNIEYGSARWGTPEDIKPYIDPVFENNVILTQTERLTMNSRPKDPKTARNKNVLVIGGSGSGKTCFFVKPNIMQLHSSYVCTDPKGELCRDTASMLLKSGYRIRIFDSINFKKSMHYNPFAYIHSEKDILKLVTTLMTNTKGDGKNSDDFWQKAETLLYCALIGYIHYEAPAEEQNFATLMEFINASEVREDDEEFENAVDKIFGELKEQNPDHFALRQYTYAKSTYDKTWEELNRQMDELAERRGSYTEAMSPDNKWIRLMKSLPETEALTSELVNAAVDKILIHTDKTIELFMKYHDIYELTGQYIHQLDGKEEASV